MMLPAYGLPMGWQHFFLRAKSGRETYGHARTSTRCDDSSFCRDTRELLCSRYQRTEVKRHVPYRMNCHVIGVGISGQKGHLWLAFPPFDARCSPLKLAGAENLPWAFAQPLPFLITFRSTTKLWRPC